MWVIVSGIDIEFKGIEVPTGIPCGFPLNALDPIDLASRIASYDQGLDVYRLSASVISPDSFMEKAYLEGLAKALRINDVDREKLNQEAKALREELMN